MEDGAVRYFTGKGLEMQKGTSNNPCDRWHGPQTFPTESFSFDLRLNSASQKECVSASCLKSACSDSAKFDSANPILGRFVRSPFMRQRRGFPMACLILLVLLGDSVTGL